jgi:integrase/recombinase XerD
MPMLTKETLVGISKALDVTCSQYSISPAETHLAVAGREEFENLIKTFIVIKKMEGLSELTLKQYLMHLTHFMESMSIPISQITGNNIRLYLFNYQQQRHVSNRSLDRIRATLCSFFRWASAEKYISSNPTESLRPIKFEERPRKALEQIELELMRKACKTKRDIAILETFYSTGCRVSELINIKLSDINWDKHTVHLLGKGKKHRTSFINAKATVAIAEYMKERKHQSDYLFCNDRGGSCMKKENIERIIRKIAIDAGLRDKKISPHVIRHTTATQALRSGMAVNDIQALLGHSNVATTMIYAHTSIDNIQAEHIRCVV